MSKPSVEGRVGVCLRPSIFSPTKIARIVAALDANESITHVFIPDILGSFDPVEVSLAALGSSRRLHVGTGVLRLPEHNEAFLGRRLETIQELSGNRFILGVGTGDPGSSPSGKIDTMLQKLETMRSNFDKMAAHGGPRMPETFIGTLKIGIARKVAGRSDGVLLNFCSPGYAKKLVDEYTKVYNGEAEFACYIKIFYSRERGPAERMFVDELHRYADRKHYHELFLKERVTEDIRSAKMALDKNIIDLPQSLSRIAMINPTPEEVRKRVREFKDAGVTIPCVTPYFPEKERTEREVAAVISLMKGF